MTDATRLDLAALRVVVAEQPYPLVFATVSGAHLYGFASRDSDVDLRGVHVLPVAEVVGLTTGPATLTRMWERDGIELDLVTHDVLKFARMLLARNGYVLEQVLSPLVVVTSPAHQELLALAPGCLTCHHAHHYRGFARSQWSLFERTGELKPLLYTLRVLLTGVHLMRSGQVEADLGALAALVPEAPPYLAELIEAKRDAEHAALAGSASPPVARLADDVTRLHAVLDGAQQDTSLPEAPASEPALHDLVIRLRLP